MKIKVELSEKQLLEIIHALTVSWEDYDGTVIDHFEKKQREINKLSNYLECKLNKIIVKKSAENRIKQKLNKFRFKE